MLSAQGQILKMGYNVAQIVATNLLKLGLGCNEPAIRIIMHSSSSMHSRTSMHSRGMHTTCNISRGTPTPSCLFDAGAGSKTGSKTVIQLVVPVSSAHEALTSDRQRPGLLSHTTPHTGLAQCGNAWSVTSAVVALPALPAPRATMMNNAQVGLEAS